jgi:hypothetical protein
MIKIDGRRARSDLTTALSATAPSSFASDRRCSGALRYNTGLPPS